MAHTPSTSPAEAPEIKSIKELQDKKADTLKYLQDIPGLNDTEKSGFAAEYEAALKALEAKTDAEKQKDIGSIKAELQRLKDQLKNEKEDENEEVDEKEDDETQETGKQKLNVEKEIRGRLDEFKKNIENKLNTPAAPEQPTEPVTPEAPSDVKGAQEFFQNKGVKLDTAPVQSNWLKNLFNKLMLGWYSMLEGLGIDVRSAKAKLEGYKDYISKQKVEETFKVLSGYMGESVKGITDIKDKEALVSKMEGLGLPIMSGDNLLSGPIMQIIFTGEESAWNNLPDDFDKDILRAVRGKYLTLQDNPKSTGGMNSLQKLNEIFTIEEDRKEDYLEKYTLDQEKRSFAAPKNNADTIPPVPPLPQEPKTPEEEQNADKQRKLTEIEKANALDKNLKLSQAEKPENKDKIEAAKNEREKLKTEVATKIQTIYKKALTDLESVENKLKVSGLSEEEKTKLGEQKKQIETAIAKIKSEAIGLIKDIEKNPAELTEIDAVKAVQIQHVIEDTYKDIEKTYQTKTQTILGEQGQKNKENEAIEAEISTVDGKIQEVVNVIGLDGNKSLTKKEIFATNEKLSDIEVLLAKIENDSQGKIEVRKKYNEIKTKFDTLKGKYKFANVGSVKTDYDEGTVDYDIDNPDAMKNVNFKRLVAMSPDQEVAYFYVENLEGKSGYLRLILSSDDKYYTDTGSAFYASEKPFPDETQAMKEIENDFFEYNFRTIEVNGTGVISDDLDWKKQTNWKAKIQALGLIIEK